MKCLTPMFKEASGPEFTSDDSERMGIDARIRPDLYGFDSTKR